MKIADHVKDFCNQFNKYSLYEGGYSGRFMMGKKCVGIVVPAEESSMKMLIELTAYLNSVDADDTDFELEGVAIDNLGLDYIVYFPNMEVAD